MVPYFIKFIKTTGTDIEIKNTSLSDNESDFLKIKLISL